MLFLFILSKENLSLAEFELETVLGKKVETIGNVAFFQPKTIDFSRLAMTRQANQVLFSCDINQLEKQMKNFDWNRYFKEDFYLSTINLPDSFSKKYLADFIYEKLNQPKVNIKTPSTIFELVFLNKEVYATKRRWENKDDFNSRKAHKRKEHHPTSIHPKLAKALVNLTGIKRGKIIDPCCGSGGILIEAALMGLKPEGKDIDKKMIARAKINLESFGIKNFKLEQKDVRCLNKCRYLVTDLPYGLASKITDKQKQNFYEDFVYTLSKKLTKRAVVVFPGFFNYKRAINKLPLKIIAEFNWFVHKNMTRNIAVIEPKTR